MDIFQLSALELGKKIKSKEIGVVEATKAVLENIEKKEPEYHCYVTVCKKEALKQAEEVQKKIRLTISWLLLMSFCVIDNY